MSRGLTLDATGAVLSLNGKSGRIHIKAGAGVQISTIGDTLIIDGKDYKAGSGITIQNDTIFNSSMKDSSNAHNGCFKHYIGEEFGGGVIFHLWKDSKGIEHGLIVDLNDLGEEIPKVLFPKISRAGTMRPITKPAIYQGQGCCVNANIEG
jgi:hypothetical protein